MSEYIIDMSNSSYQSTSGLLCADVSQLREEIIRCRDCENLTTSYPMWACVKFGIYLGLVKDEPDGFCKWGERK